MENHAQHWTSSLYFFLAGGLAGAAAGLLLAPRSGKLTREIMGRKVHETVESARELGARAARESEDLRHRAAEGLSKMAAAVAPGTPRRTDGREGHAISA